MARRLIIATRAQREIGEAYTPGTKDSFPASARGSSKLWMHNSTRSQDRPRYLRRRSAESGVRS